MEFTNFPKIILRVIGILLIFISLIGFCMLTEEFQSDLEIYFIDSTMLVIFLVSSGFLLTGIGFLAIPVKGYPGQLMTDSHDLNENPELLEQQTEERRQTREEMLEERRRSRPDEYRRNRDE